MTNQRVFLWAALALILWLNYEAWMRDYHPDTPAPPPPAARTSGEQSADVPAPPTLDQAAPNIPAAPESSTARDSAVTQPEPAAAAAPGAPVVRVITDVLDMDIGLQGGELVRADLLRYPKHKNQPELVRLLDPRPAQKATLQSGLTSGNPASQPDHLARFESPRREYRLVAGQQQLSVPLTWTSGGVSVTKTFSFERGSYRIGLAYDIENRSTDAWRASSYLQILKEQPEVDRSMFDVESYSSVGPAIYDGKAYRKLDIEDEEDRSFKATIADGWIAALQHHFVTATAPAPGQPYLFSLHAKNREFLLQAVGPPHTFAAGARGALAETLYVGPKLQEQLEKAGPRLELTADYGKLTIIAKPLFKLLEWVYGLVGNWGWAIVIVTALIKLAFYPLSEASGRSMAKMRALAPRIKNVQERYKDDREQLGRAMMELYKREKINPLAGCLPILVQIPVFLAFYWVLLESVEMRQAPFLLWIDDLSSRDPWFVLPVLMGLAMFGQYKLNPTPPDPVQAKVFMFMPVIMTVMFAWFPSGLVLYWLTNTLLSIAQQWRINRVVEAKEKKEKKA